MRTTVGEEGKDGREGRTNVLPIPRCEYTRVPHHEHLSQTLPKAGGMAGTAVDLLFFPIDTVKTRLQSAQGFVRAGGFRGIYKGVGSVVVGSAPGGV